LDICFEYSAGFRERPGMIKNRVATSTGSDVHSPSSIGLSRHIFTSRSFKYLSLGKEQQQLADILAMETQWWSSS
jgi:hypothetical protein